MCPVGVSDPQFSMISEKPMSLPPIPSVTTSVPASRLSNCAGFGPGVTPCGSVMSPVSAPLQLGSRNSATPSASARRCG
jgi:hypothetical protein